MDQRVWERVEKVDSYCEIHEFYRIAKQRAGEERDVVGVSCRKDGAVKVSVDDQKNLEGAYESNEN